MARTWYWSPSLQRWVEVTVRVPRGWYRQFGFCVCVEKPLEERLRIAIAKERVRNSGELVSYVAKFVQSGVYDRMSKMLKDVHSGGILQ